MKSRKTFFGANWKMNKNLKESKDFFVQASQLNYPNHSEVVFFPPAHLILPLKDLYGNQYKIGAQNFFSEDQGAYTGEISAWMLKEEGIQYSIIGHSERRSIFHENDDLLLKKVTKGLNLGLKIIFCVGETLVQRENQEHFHVIEKQLNHVLSSIKLNSSQDLIIAYEPVWAIGTGKNATPEQAQEIHQFIRFKIHGLKLPAEQIRIIYGGSVKPDNIKDLMNQSDIDGALVGGASLNPEHFLKIVDSI